MKKHHRRFAPLLLPLFASAMLVSCVAPGYQGEGYYSSGGGGHVVYTTLPDTFVGSAYYYDGRYYSGGSYQTGRYSDHGRSYSDRYYYNGRYYYGGNYQQHRAKGARQEQRKDNRNAPGSQKTSDRTNEQPPGRSHGQTGSGYPR